jgi:hypothetical protein
VYEELTRPINERERSELTNLLTNSVPRVTVAGTVGWVCVWTGGLLFCAFVTVVLVSLNPVIGGIIGGALSIAGVICLYAIILVIGTHRRWARTHQDFVRHETPQIQMALENGHVLVKKVSGNAVIEIVKFEAEGSGYIYDIGDGRILFLKGQRFIPVDEDMGWPNSEFEIVRTVDGDLCVGIFCFGKELPPIRELEASECIDEVVWADREEVLEGDIEQFAKSITNAA